MTCTFAEAALDSLPLRAAGQSPLNISRMRDAM